MMEDKIKQVIVMRTEYPDGKGGTTGLRKGKLIAQGSHASMAFLTRRIDRDVNRGTVSDDDGWSKTQFILSPVEMEWLEGSFAKVCVKVNSEEELLDVYEKAKEAGLEVHLITDSGRTEFHGVPTNTCLAIGPDYSSKIDPITGELTLL